MNLEEYKGVYVFAQQVDNEVSSIALELIGKGKDLAKDLNTTVTAVLVGSNVMGLTEILGEYGADTGTKVTADGCCADQEYVRFVLLDHRCQSMGIGLSSVLF